ncbi:MAG TPA: hypothetical protein VJT15_10375 [Pyrinomonadaceae bacterium]|nr:hypothetical protein [Pyrinomonadaceae bacterium]
MIVAFIAGYSVVSFLARKVKNARDRHPVDERRDDDTGGSKGQDQGPSW